MKKIILGTVFLLSSSSYAGDCLERVRDTNWPEDKNELVLDCNLVSVDVGKHSTEKICFAIQRSQFSDYKTKFFKTVRYNSGEAGANFTIVSMNENGKVPSDSEVSVKGDILKVSQVNNSYEHNQKWVESTIVDIENQNLLTFNIYDKKFFSTTLKESARYSCVRVN